LTVPAPETSGFVGPEDVRLRAWPSGATSGGEALDPAPITILGLWQAVPSVAAAQALEEITELQPLLDTAGVRLSFAGPERWMAQLSEVAHGLGAEVFVDAAGSATEAFGGWRSRQYVVISDGAYSVHYDVRDAVRVALLLARERERTPEEGGFQNR